MTGLAYVVSKRCHSLRLRRQIGEERRRTTRVDEDHRFILLERARAHERQQARERLPRVNGVGEDALAPRQQLDGRSAGERRHSVASAEDRAVHHDLLGADSRRAERGSHVVRDAQYLRRKLPSGFRDGEAVNSGIETQFAKSGQHPRLRAAGGGGQHDRHAALAEGVELRQTWRIPRRGYASSLELVVEGPRADAFASAHPLELAIEPTGELSAVELGEWRGVRSRFWTFIARRDAGSHALARTFRVYSGPIELGMLRATDPALAGLLFPHLWFWMRWLALGLLLMLDALCGLVGNAGVAIVLLAVCVKILMRPLSGLAERWQRDVNELHSLLQPQIEAIKASSRGAERSQRLLALHREHGVSPFFGLKSLLSVAIQIPIFFAAYHALDESFALASVPFLWIADLAEPDRFAAFPRPIPFFGATLNLLPFVMSAVTLLSSRLHDDGTLAPKLLRRQRLGLYAMALAFFLLFYSFPAGMVLYWTSNNLIALIWEAVSRRLPRWRDRTGRLAIGTIRR